jgi:uncharacterized protein (TIGR03435 family)
MRLPLNTSLLVFAVSRAALSQPAPSFEVASIKPSAAYRPGSPSGVHLDGARFTSSGIPLRNLIYSAYGVPSWAVSGGPGWLDSEAYDIAATVPPATSDEQVRLMLKTLFADRFQLTVHREMREHSVYDLVVAKNGPKFKSSEATKASIKNGLGHIELHGIAIAVLANSLWSTKATARPVVDMTGLKGHFDITLDWAPEDVQLDVADRGPSVFTAIEEQLGLKLEPRKSPFEFIIIDHVERPSAN